MNNLFSPKNSILLFRRSPLDFFLPLTAKKTRDKKHSCHAHPCVSDLLYVTSLKE